MRNERGFSFAEVLVALLILAVVITTTLVMFTERQRRMRLAKETIISYQVLANEVEFWRRQPLAFIDDTSNQQFQTPTTLLAPLAPFVTLVQVARTNDDVRQVTFIIRWESGKREAKLSIARVNIGGPDPLW